MWSTVDWSLHVDIDTEIQRFRGEIFNASNLPRDTVSILIPPDAFANQTSAETNIVFSAFSSSDLYPSVNQTFPFGVNSSVVSATVVGSEISSNITIVLKLNVPVCC